MLLLTTNLDSFIDANLHRVKTPSTSRNYLYDKVITQAWFESPIEITEPGVYGFSKSLVHENNDSGIVIKSSNVTLDLGGFFLYYSGSESGINGIEIDPGLNNITIRNGAIYGFTGSGILANGSSSSSIRELAISNVSASENYGGFNLQFIKEGLISSCSTNNNLNATSSLSSTTGTLLNGCTTTVIKNLTSNGNSGNAACYGIDLQNCTAVNLSSCSANANTASTDDCHGIRNYRGSNNKIESSAANNNLSSTGNSMGIQLEETSNTTVEQCRSIENIASHSTKHSFGVRVVESEDSMISGNTIQQNFYGIYDDSEHTRNVFMKNIGYSNTIDYHRPNSTAIPVAELTATNLKSGALISDWENIKIVDT